jgi:hypothetical protein
VPSQHLLGTHGFPVRFSFIFHKIILQPKICMMKYLILLLAPVSSAFTIKPLQPIFSWQLKEAKSFDTSKAVGFDKERAVECAQTFGRCSIEEVTNLRDCKCVYIPPTTDITMRYTCLTLYVQQSTTHASRI